MSRLHSRRLRLAPLLLLLSGCASSGGPGPVAPADPAVLEAEAARQAQRPDGLTRVGIAFYETGRHARARDVLAAALALDPRSFRAAVYLGLAHEALGEWEAAQAAYRRAGGLAGSRGDRALVEQRLTALTRARFADAARRAIAAEAGLGADPPAPNTIAVLRFSYFGPDSALKPIETGLTHLVVTDLAKVGRFTLLEREAVQALADELALSAEGRVEPGTAARSGRLLRASTVVQGAVRESGSGVRLDAAMVNTADTAVRAQASASDRLQELIAMEKAVVLQLLERLGVSLTPAERRAIEERPTADLQAFLAFSRGLEAEYRGDLSGARRAFQDAAGIDPAFRAARDRAAAVQRAQAAGPERLAALAARAGGRPRGRDAGPGARANQLRTAIQTVAPTLAGKLRFGPLPPGMRSRLAEALRQDDPSRIGSIGDIVVIIPRP